MTETITLATHEIAILSEYCAFDRWVRVFDLPCTFSVGRGWMYKGSNPSVYVHLSHGQQAVVSFR